MFRKNGYLQLNLYFRHDIIREQVANCSSDFDVFTDVGDDDDYKTCFNSDSKECGDLSEISCPIIDCEETMPSEASKALVLSTSKVSGKY